jgi:hypothetical protein
MSWDSFLESGDDKLARHKQEKTDEKQRSIAPHVQALNSLRTQQAMLLDANKTDPNTGMHLPAKGKEQEYNALMDQMQEHIHAVRDVFHPPSEGQPGAAARFRQHLTDRMHLTNSLTRVNKENEKGEKSQDKLSQDTQTFAQGAPPNPYVDKMAQLGQAGFSPEEQRQAILPKGKENLKLYKLKNGTNAWIDASKPELIPEGATAVGTGTQGVKGVKGSLVSSKQSPTGFAQTWVDPYNPSKIVGWQPVTPSRYYQGTQTERSSTDPLTGLVTKSGSTTTPLSKGSVDLSGISQTGELGPDGDTGIPQPAAGADTASPQSSQGADKPEGPGVQSLRDTSHKLRNQPPSPAPASAQPSQGNPAKTLQLDTAGHIPVGATPFPAVVDAANRLIDGEDIHKIQPNKLQSLASDLAKKYGWHGQGLFTPREVLQLKEGATLIDQMLKSDSLGVLDQGTISNLPMLGQSTDPSKAGMWGRLTTSIASKSATPKQQEFMRLWRQLDALAVGLRNLVQTGRATQTQVDRIIAEFPNPYNTTSADDARQRLRMVQNELRVASETGKLPDVPLGEKGGGGPDLLKRLKEATGAK